MPSTPEPDHCILIKIQPITAKDYIIAHHSTVRFDLIELLKTLQPNPDDRDLVEQEIKDAVTEILKDENTESSLKKVASAIASSQFRNLCSNPDNNYWDVLKLRKESNQNAVNMQEIANSQLVKSVLEGYNIRPRVKQPTATEDKDIFETDSAVLDGMKKSVGLTVKSEAVKLAKAEKTFSELSDKAKDAVYPGLNLIVDLSNNTTASGTQRLFFPGS
ncbi:hypothetical protein CLU79DRAFT_342840 [Phycomyces nitens]|nr:hypothetical protein CLU79DRAFT_342840 [Phycomyces nitens]